MSRPHPWTDAYVVTVAHQLAWLLAPAWAHIESVDPALTIDLLKRPLRELEGAGLPVAIDAPAFEVPAALAPVVDCLYDAVGRVREAGVRAFDAPALLHLRQPCTAQFPMTYFGMRHAGTAARDEVELLNLGDLPEDDPDWLDRTDAAEFIRLQALSLFGHDLSSGTGIQLGQLPALAVLDLSECRLTCLPAEAHDLPALRWLSLAGNPLEGVPDLSGFPALRYLSLRRTGVEADYVAPIRDRGVEVAL